MFKVVFASANLEFWPTLALIIFFGIMTGVILWVWRPKSTEFYRHISQLPLDGNTDQKGVL